MTKVHKRLNTGMAPTCDWKKKIVKVNKLYLNSLLVSIEQLVYNFSLILYPLTSAYIFFILFSIHFLKR